MYKMDYGQYIVKKGDSLYLIAQKYNTTAEELMRLNNLNSTMIYPNQVLFVPYSSNGQFNCMIYKTQNGDSINKIASEFNITKDELMLYNDLYRLELVPNQVINLECPDKTYTVLADDTIDTIMQKTGLSCLQIMQLNPGLLSEGTKINVKWQD